MKYKTLAEIQDAINIEFLDFWPEQKKHLISEGIKFVEVEEREEFITDWIDGVFIYTKDILKLLTRAIIHIDDVNEFILDGNIELEKAILYCLYQQIK